MLQLIQRDLNFEPEGKIVKAAEYRRLLDANQLVEAAETEAQRIIADAKVEFQQQKELGYQEGLNVANVELSAKMAETVKRTHEYFADIELSLVDIVVRTTRKIIGDMDSRDVAVRVIERTLQMARDQAQVTIRVPAEDVEAVKARVQDLIAPYPVIRFVDVIADSKLAPGGCVLETDVGVVDASVDTQLEAIRQSLEKGIDANQNSDATAKE